METQDKNYNRGPQIPDTTRSGFKLSGRIMGGLVIVIAGTVLLAHQFGLWLPHWLFSWPMILIGIGVYVGARHSFRSWGWLIPVVIGTFFLAEDIAEDFFDHIHLGRIFWPLFIIGIGLYIMFRPRKKKGVWDNYSASENEGGDYIDSTTVFGGVKKNIITKSFKGGEISAVFGGMDIILSQADLTGPAVLDVTAVFGGVKIVAPPHWKLETRDLVTIFGGMDDKRPQVTESQLDSNKVLILKGFVMFGGIELKSH